MHYPSQILMFTYVIETDKIVFVYLKPLNFAFFRNVPASSILEVSYDRLIAYELKFINEIAIIFNCLYNYIKSLFKTNY